MSETTIEWTRSDDGTPGKTWNPIRGCTRVSRGCEHCYAERVAARFSGPGLPYEGLARIGKNGARWTGDVRLVPEHLADPLRWRRPRRVFVNSMSDLFHEGLTNEQIAAVFGVMAAAPRHTFQVLTKRAKRMRDWFAWASADGTPLRQVCIEASAVIGSPAIRGRSWTETLDDGRWPLPNVWLGVSAEDQATADERIPDLIATPAAVRFVSYEPALGPVDLSVWMLAPDERKRRQDAAYWAFSRQANAKPPSMADPQAYAPGLSWVIVGGESGPGARPCDLAWIESVVDQCRAAAVPVFVKQLGAYVVSELRTAPADMMTDPAKLKPTDFAPSGEVWAWRAGLNDRKGGDINEFPEALRVREFPR